MDAFTLKDYRASHFLMIFMKSQVQGWYTRENILAKADHPDGNKEKLTTLRQLIDKINCWNEVIQPGEPPFIKENGSIVRPESVKDICRILQLLFEQYIAMNGRLNDILDNEVTLQDRRQDVQYIVAIMGWVYYAINHAVHGDNSFAGRFGDQELLRSRNGDAEASQKELDFVNYLFHSFKDETLYNPKTCSDLGSMAEALLNENLKGFAVQADKYLSILKN